MLYRKIEKDIKNYLISNSNKVLIIEGARQIGKTFIIRKVGKELFENFKEMYQLDFEEFLIANGFSFDVIDDFRESFKTYKTIDENIHSRIMDLFKKYLIVGGLPDAVNSFIKNVNVVEIRNIQSDIVRYYSADASKFDKEHKLKISRIY